MTEPFITPLVKQLADQYGVNLADVRGTGVARRITAADVRRAAGILPRPTGYAAASRPRPHLTITSQSRWLRHTSSGTGSLVERPMVEIDVYGPNPLIDELRQADPRRYAEAENRGGKPPTLFVTGDLPLFTASGVDPNVLLQLPWVARHAAARATPSDAVVILEAYGAVTERNWWAAVAKFVTDHAVMGYEQRVHAWADPRSS